MIDAIPVWNLRNPLVTAIASLKVEVGSPVVGEIFRVAARGAGGELTDVGVGDSDVESVASDDLVQVRRWELSWVDERVDSIDDQLRAAETQHSGPATLSFS